jgi:hypothetical protein
VAGLNPSTQSPGWSIHALEASPNALDAFQSEATQAEKPPAPPDKPASERVRVPVSLSSLKAAGIQLNGDEAIAIGRALCRVFATMQILRRVKPDAATAASEPVTADTIFIDGTSRVGLTVDVPYDIPTAIHAIGRVLSDILPTNTRLFIQTSIISKALASPPQFGSVDELSQALGAFEPANGKELIEAIYERWEKRNAPSSPPAAVVPEKIGLEKIVPEKVLPDKRVSDKTSSISQARPESAISRPMPETKPVDAAGAGYQSVIALGAATVAAVAMIVIGGSFLLGRWQSARVERAPLETRPIARMMFGYLPDVTPAWVAKGSNPRQIDTPAITPPSAVHIGAAASKSSQSGLAERRVRPARSASVARPGRRPAAASAPLARSTIQPSPAAVPSAETRPQPDASSAVGTSADVRRSGEGGGRQSDRAVEATTKAVAPAKPSEAVSPAPASVRVYNASDADVSAPVPVQPRLLAGLRPSSPGVRFDALVIAVVVNADGKAFSVSAVNPPQSMSESVLLTAALSVVKQWQFKPATKEGVPVRYRLIVPLRSVTPQ